MIIFVLLLLVLLLSPFLAPIMGPFLMWIAAFLILLALMRLMSAPTPAAVVKPIPPPLPSYYDDAAVSQVMEVSRVQGEGGVRVYEGVLHEKPDRALDMLKRALTPLGKLPLIQPAEQGRVHVILAPRPSSWANSKPSRLALHWLLFILTFLTTTFAGAAYQGINLLSSPEMFHVGLPYSIALLAILGCHELGHYFVARARGQNVTPPFFIPAPFGLGTFGAFIQLRSPSDNRKALFDVAMAGPIAGLVVAVPALLIGLHYSEIVPFQVPELSNWFFGGRPKSSLLLYAFTTLTHGQATAAGSNLVLSPLAFAGWIGMVVTALNLLPIGQLDGGHTVHALLGARGGRFVSRLALFALFAVAVFFRGEFLLWAILVYFIAGTRDVPPLDDVTPVGIGRTLAGILGLLILLLIVVPVR